MAGVTSAVVAAVSQRDPLESEHTTTIIESAHGAQVLLQRYYDKFSSCVTGRLPLDHVRARIREDELIPGLLCP